MAMDSVTLQRINSLYAENRQVRRAILQIDTGGRILDMSIGKLEEDNVPARVTTDYMNYPPQMIQSIKGLLTTRRDQIQAELAGLGFTGDLELPPEPEPPPEE